MEQQSVLVAEQPALTEVLCELDPDAKQEAANALIRDMRKAAKRSKRLVSWVMPLVLMGMLLTIFVSSRYDIRLSLGIFAAIACIVGGGLVKDRFRWERLAKRAMILEEVRAIGPLLTLWNSGDDSALDAVETALVTLLPRVQRLSQLSREARKGLNRLLLQEEGHHSKGKRGYNAELIYTALQTVARLRDNYALPGVRRLAEGFGPLRPVASIRDLAQDILPALEESSVLLRAAPGDTHAEKALLRPCSSQDTANTVRQLLRPVNQDVDETPVDRLTGETTPDLESDETTVRNAGLQFRQDQLAGSAGRNRTTENSADNSTLHSNKNTNIDTEWTERKRVACENADSVEICSASARS